MGRMIVTIDGPAGAGKSTVAQAVARVLGFEFLDTGAMYRMVTLAALEQQVDLNNAQELSRLAGQLEMTMESGRFWIGSREVTQAIRQPQVSRQVSAVADPPQVRQVLVQQQREIVGQRDFVTEGRDQGTVVFPNAECKIFLTASPETRARRRYDQQGGDSSQSWEDVLAEQNDRDRRDRERPVGGLKQADDAIVVQTDQRSLDEVVETIVQIVRRLQETRHEPRLGALSGQRLDGSTPPRTESSD